jgi:hypothetical protein
VKRYGAASPAVKAWLAAQDVVFKACGMDGVALPPPMPNAPAWLTEDRAYQQAALDLYSRRNRQAAREFEAIARDPAYAEARAAVASLAAAPEAFGHDQAAGLMTDVLDFHQTPDAMLARRTQEVEAADPSPWLAVEFRDYTDLGEAAKMKPEALDWIDTIRAMPPNPPAGDETPAQGPLATGPHGRRRWLTLRPAGRRRATWPGWSPRPAC